MHLPDFLQLVVEPRRQRPVLLLQHQLLLPLRLGLPRLAPGPLLLRGRDPPGKGLLLGHLPLM